MIVRQVRSGVLEQRVYGPSDAADEAPSRGPWSDPVIRISSSGPRLRRDRVSRTDAQVLAATLIVLQAP